MDFDTQAAVWDRKSDKEMQNIARQLNLDADDTVPLKFTQEQRERIRNYPKTVQFNQKSKELIRVMRQSGYRS
jgi:predicted enzyme involved in methoxymalonyl-ACP biosynthesis